MSTEPLDILLRSLSQGDAGAAAYVFRTYEPILRMVVRRRLSTRLRTKFDSTDVVQSVWVEVLDGVQNKGWQFQSAEHLKAFLIRMTNRRFADRCDKERYPLAHQRPLPRPDADNGNQPAGPQPTPSQEVQALDVWDQLMSLCPPAHHELLRFKRQGMTFPEIAERTGLHQSSVRRIIYDLAKRIVAPPRTQTNHVAKSSR